MLIVQKLYIRDFLKVLATLAVGISLIFSLIALIDKIDEFMPYKPSAGLLMQFTLFTAPKYLHYLLPMATLLSSLFVFSQAVERKEITIIKASSGKIRSVLMPFMGIGIVLVILGFILGEVVVPASTKKIHSIKNRITKKSKEFAFREGTLYMRGRDGSIIRIALYLPNKNISKGVTVFTFDGNALKERIDAETAEWKNNSWELRDVTDYDIAAGKAIRSPVVVYKGIESPKIFQEDVWSVEEMNLVELVKYQQRLKEAGFKNIKFTVDISSRLAYPLINLFLLMLGISLSLGGDFVQKASQMLSKNKAKEGAHMGGGIIAAGLGLLISMFYWLGYSVFLSLGYTGAIPPIIAPWIVPLFFSMVSVYLYSQIPE